ncbi:DUF3152 domain-containing protein [Nocardiopsis gilva YIM 90087]|uniref:DUF3152 domain-containing protein n=1 Tax=Nocardiopsis gilva YIM 90087 TaxID=1235441 RepID=A0A223SAN2_9ACTN|nr:DUF3152 domain-containing protein [Nocardiopsis gilva]ASU85191.1 DUF3152 domain-containing protein [Nocardiopsis gilva YIM 90087]
MSRPESDAARERTAGRHRRGRYRLELILGLAAVAAGVSLIVIDDRTSGHEDGVETTASTPAAPSPSAGTDGSPGERRAAADDGAEDSGEDEDAPVLLRSVEDEVKDASGDLKVVPGTSDVAGKGPLKRYMVEVEKGLPGDPEDFAAAVDQVLSDKRSWIADGAVSMQRVDSGPVDFRVTLAAPDTVDSLCAPLRTMGYVSCHQGERSVINQNRWVSGVKHFDDDLETYRTYVINHEVGHALGKGHVPCPGRGETAPVMQQQTFGLDGCEANGWPNP